MKFRIFSKLLSFAVMLCLLSSYADVANKKVKSQLMKFPVADMIDRRVCEAFPSDCICKDTLRNLSKLKKTLNDCCDTLDQRFTELEIKVQKINPCGTPTPIDQAFVDSALTNPITVSGVYCLVEDVTGLLTIDADDVVIHMNNHSITGASNAVSATGHTNVQLLGLGIIKSGNPNGVFIETCTNVKIDGISFEENLTACRFNQVNNFVISNCFFVDNNSEDFPLQPTALALLASSVGKITCCNFRRNVGFSETCRVHRSSSVLFSNNSFNNNNTAITVRIFESNSCVFDSCSGNANTVTNAGVFSFEGSSDVLCVNCESNANLGGATGFLARASSNAIKSTNIMCDGCRSSNNSGGFSIIVSNSCYFTDCLAKQNKIGFVVSTSADNYIYHNTAIANTNFGYTFSGGGLGNVWLSNYAQGNGTNYQTPAIPGPFSVFTISTGIFAPTETAWSNIDAVP